MRFLLTLFTLLLPAALILAAPIDVTKKDADADADPQGFGSYGDYAPPPGGYGDYPAPAGGYGDYPAPAAPAAPAGGYGDYPPPAGGYGDYPTPEGGYGSYGSYKRDGVEEAAKE